MFVLYSATGKNGFSYYGYTKEEDFISDFRKHAIKKSEKSRASSILWEANGCDLKNFSFEIIEVFETEFEAWQARNDVRANESDSIVGPSLLPAVFVKDADNERLNVWKKTIELHTAKTAREAFSLGKWTKDQVYSLVEKFQKSEIVRDLDKLSPMQFSFKYFGVN